MIAAHLPILQVVAPLIAAPACALLRRGTAAWAFAVGVSALCLLIAAMLLAQVWTAGPISYAIGDWAPPWGIEYRIDALNALVLLVVSGIGTVTMLFARASVAQEIAPDKRVLFYSAYLLCLTGLLGIAATGDAFNVFVFMEISSLSSYALIAMGRDPRALLAAYQYLIMGTLGATFILIGIGLMYMMTGTLNMADLAERLPPVAHTSTVHAAFAFLTVGISLKLALFPLHLWLPNAYTYAPSVVTIFLAATATKVALYLLLRFFFTVFGEDFSFEIMRLDLILLPLSVAAIVTASTVAIFQDNVKRMLAYSSIAQIGYMTLGIGMASTAGLMAGILHLFNHALIKGGLFLALGCVMYRIGSTHIERLAGLGRRMPWTFAAFVAGGLSLIGIPPTAGFISKWYLVAAALERGWWWLGAFVLFTSLLTAIYIWRVVEAAYFRAAPEGIEKHEAPLALLFPTWLLIGANFYFGLETSLSAGGALRAAQALLGNGP